jgi:hypothetical protein
MIHLSMVWTPKTCEAYPGRTGSRLATKMRTYVGLVEMLHGQEMSSSGYARYLHALGRFWTRQVHTPIDERNTERGHIPTIRAPL